MRRFVQHTTLGIILLLSSLISFAQVTPVQVTPQLVPPYSLQVSEYYSGSIPKIQVLLINRDINQPTIQVKLKMTVESQNCRLRTKEVNTVPAITLTNGVPYYLATNELQALFSSANLDFGGGLSEQQYNQTLRLPEGLYTFTFEAYELYSGNLVSNKGFSMGWLTLADPPLLNTPSKGEEVTPTASQNIVFNWTPRHNTSPTAAYYTEYLFTLVEYNDAALSPEAAFASSNPILQKTVITTTMPFNSQEPITTNLEEGKRYAWRVQAKAKSNTNAQEIAMFRNNGISEVHWFVYKNSCTAPQGITVNVQGQRATIEWQNNPLHLEWKVEYREQNNPKAEWFTLSNTLPRVVIMDLKPSTNYEYRVGGACYVNQFTYSPLNYFSTANAPVPPVVNCGDSTFPALGTAGLQTLNPGDTIRAGSFVVKVGYSTGSGSFTGTGYVIVPWLMNAKVEVKFTNITMSTDYKLVSGLIETTYDPTESGIGDLDEYIEALKDITSIVKEIVNYKADQEYAYYNTLQQSLKTIINAEVSGQMVNDFNAIIDSISMNKMQYDSLKAIYNSLPDGAEKIAIKQKMNEAEQRFSANQTELVKLNEKREKLVVEITALFIKSVKELKTETATSNSNSLEEYNSEKNMIRNEIYTNENINPVTPSSEEYVLKGVYTEEVPAINVPANLVTFAGKINVYKQKRNNYKILLYVKSLEKYYVGDNQKDKLKEDVILDGVSLIKELILKKDANESDEAIKTYIKNYIKEKILKL